MNGHVMRPIEYLIAVVPEGHPLRDRFSDMDVYAIEVSWRGKPWNDPTCLTDDRWAVKSGGRVLHASGELVYEPSPSNRTVDDYRCTRFPLVEAERLALILAAQRLADLEAKHSGIPPADIDTCDGDYFIGGQCGNPHCTSRHLS